MTQWAMKAFVQSALLALLIGSVPAYGAPNAVNTIETRDVAIHGYDPVSYFDDQKPLRGDPGISATWNEVKWYFASEENKERFLSRPKHYQPMFGGYCAFSTAAGYKADIDPKAWALHDNHLFLFYNEETKKKWEQRRERLIPLAEGRWHQLKDEPAI